MSGKKYGRCKEDKRKNRALSRILTVMLTVAFCLAGFGTGAYAEETSENLENKAVRQQLEETIKQQTQQGTAGQQETETPGRKLQEAMRQAEEDADRQAYKTMGQQVQDAEAYTDAVMLALTEDRETGELDNSGSLTCLAVSYEGYTYVFTAGDYEDFDYDKYYRITGNLDGETYIYMVPLAGNLQICFGVSHIENQVSVPVGEMDPDADLNAAFFDYDEEEGRYTRMSGSLSGSLERIQGGYILDEDLGAEEKWNGALVVDARTEEAVGIGVYLDGQYLIHDIPTDVLEDYVALENWGELPQAETEETEGETEKAAKETAETGAQDGNPETEDTETITEAERSEEAGEDEEATEPETEKAAAKGENRGPEEKEPVPEGSEEKAPGKTGSMSPSMWIVVLTGIVVVIVLAESRRSRNRKENPPVRPENSAQDGSEGLTPTPSPSGTILLGSEQRQSQYILECLSGPAEGKQIVIYDNFNIGRDSQFSDVALPEDTKGVSRRHCRIEIRDNMILLRDLDSSCGTFLENGRKLEAQTPYNLDSGTVFYLGSRQVAFRVTKK